MTRVWDVTTTTLLTKFKHGHEIKEKDVRHHVIGCDWTVFKQSAVCLIRFDISLVKFFKFSISSIFGKFLLGHLLRYSLIRVQSSGPFLKSPDKLLGILSILSIPCFTSGGVNSLVLEKKTTSKN